MNWKRGFGISLVLIGLFIFFTGRVLTGAVIGVSFENFLGLFGILILFAGFAFFFLTQMQERRKSRRLSLIEEGASLEDVLELSIISGKLGKEYTMTDPNSYFTNQKQISLNDFKDIIEMVRKSPEQLKEAREQYNSALTSIEENPKESEDRREIAGMFLNVLFPERPEARQHIQVYISKKALERSEKNGFVREHMEDYLSEIEKIRKNPLERPQESIKQGGFRISPRGRSEKGLRVAWHFDNSRKILFIDDFLYHESKGGYVNRWNKRVRSGMIAVGSGDYDDSKYSKL